jgi:hypothetical protein
MSGGKSADDGAIYINLKYFKGAQPALRAGAAGK